jgi:hypothetical protein
MVTFDMLRSVELKGEKVVNLESGGASAGWSPSSPWPSPEVTPLTVGGVRFSQCTVGGPTRVAGEELSLPDLASLFAAEGYISEPIHVVQMPDGELTSLDNRRLWAAREAGLDEVTALVMHWTDPMMLPGRRARSLVADTDLIDQDGEFGARGQLISLQGSTPQTALQAIAHRALRQRNRLGVADFPLSGSLELPRYSGEIRGPTAQSARLRERLDAARRVGSGKDGEVPMLQRQLRFSHRRGDQGKGIVR